ncbi:MAG TPA: T9SS type A sorting domain-containing protein, partial [Bacteroidia bacterium]|nr:T9SS type A sorting domain-containing protein [Bacteroidia bacterium]
QPGTVTGPTSVCKSQTAVVYSIAAVTGATSYKWEITGASIVGSTTGTSVTVKYTTSTTTTATLKVRSKNSCGYSAYRTITITINPNCRIIDGNIVEFTGVAAYPNPTMGKITIEHVEAFDTDVQISVSDMIGKLHSVEKYFTAGNKSVELDLSPLNEGVYFIRIVDQNGEQILRVVKL